MIGKRLAHYEITERIGEGGMGVVWKATDTTLGRSVAIKVLPELLARDPERLARLEREARLLAALSHPNIASIYGLHEDQGVRFLAMELAQGESLAARLQRGPLPADEALAVGLKIAEALEHAHENGIVHRDLKPANVVIGPEGGVKVLDFGLAKAFESDPSGVSNPSLTQSPTITAGMTAANVVLGTAAYMSPEQARGQAADKRADVWSFGVVLYEMLTGARMFEGDTVSDVLAAVLRADFEWQRLPDSVPPRVRLLLERCLQRDRRTRLRDIGEARIVLAAEITGAPDPYTSSLTGAAAPAPAAAPGSSLSRLMWPAGIGVLALAAGLLLGRGLPHGSAAKTSMIPHREFRLPSGGAARLPQISPDGRRAAWLETDTLVIQDLDSTEPRRLPLPARTSASHLFWAPDGSELGYVSGSTLQAVDMRTREVRQICDASGPFTNGSGASWGDDGIITMSRAEDDGLLQVPAVGGDPRSVSPADSVIGDYHDPYALTGGRGVLFCAHLVSGTYDNIYVFDGHGYRQLLKVEGHQLSDPVYSNTGHILYRRNDPSAGIWAVPFSLEKLEVTGEPFIVVPGAHSPSVAADGTLLFLAGQNAAQSDLVLAGPDGTIRSTITRIASPGGIMPALSPDGRRVVYEQQEGVAPDLWVADLDRGTQTRLTFSEYNETVACWSPDGRSVLYDGRSPDNSWCALRRPADGSGAPDTLVRGALFPSLTPDGRSLLYTALPGTELKVRPVDGGEATTLPVKGMAKAVVSPGGRLVAYVSDESGNSEVFLRRFPSGDGRWQVSTTGGDWPVWGAEGRRLYYANDDDVMAVDLTPGDAPVLGQPRRLFTRPRMSHRGIAGWSARFGVNPDGTEFVFALDVESGSSTSRLVLDQNWFQPFRKAATD